SPSTIPPPSVTVPRSKARAFITAPLLAPPGSSISMATSGSRSAGSSAIPSATRWPCRCWPTCTFAARTCPRSTPTAGPSSTPSWNRPRRSCTGWPSTSAAATSPSGPWRAARAEGITYVGRLPRNAALCSLPPAVPEGERGRGRPRRYGTRRLSLAKRAGHAQGWQEVECWQYQERRTKRVKTFLATWRPAGGVIRVVLVKEDDGWIAYFCTDPNATVVDILESAAGRTALEQTFKDVKGAGQQQLRYWRANVGAFHWCLWNYTAVEWWAWQKTFGELVDRSQAPWDETERRTSHAEKRKALQREMLRDEFWRVWGNEPCAAKMQQWVEFVLAMPA